MRSRPLVLPILAVALGGALAACSSGGSPKPSTARAVPVATIRLVAGPVTIRSTGSGGSLPDGDRDAIVAAASAYVDQATLAPLTGRRADDLASLFTAATAARPQGPDRGVLTDDGLPRTTGRVRIDAQPVALTGLTDGAGHPVVVAAALDVSVRAPSKAGDVTVKRTGELAFVNDGGTWKIESYRLLVTRDGGGLGSTTSTAVAGS